MRIKQAQNQVRNNKEPDKFSLHVFHSALRQFLHEKKHDPYPFFPLPDVPKHVQDGGRTGWGLDERQLWMECGPVCGADAATTDVDGADGGSATTTAAATSNSGQFCTELLMTIDLVD